MRQIWFFVTVLNFCRNLFHMLRKLLIYSRPYTSSHCRWKDLSMKRPVDEKTCRWKGLSMKRPVDEMTLSMKRPVDEMTLSMKRPVDEMTLLMKWLCRWNDRKPWYLLIDEKYHNHYYIPITIKYYMYSIMYLLITVITNANAIYT